MPQKLNYVNNILDITLWPGYAYPIRFQSKGRKMGEIQDKLAEFGREVERLTAEFLAAATVSDDRHIVYVAGMEAHDQGNGRWIYAIAPNFSSVVRICPEADKDEQIEIVKKDMAEDAAMRGALLPVFGSGNPIHTI